MENNSIPGIESPETLAKRLGLKYRDILILSRALTHRSYLNEHPEAIEDNERLEFLGDAVLDFTVGAWLYHHFPEMPEGDLTRMRSALVYTEQLARFARKINLGQAMRLGRGEINAGGRDRTPLLCDTFEAVIGSIYIDQGIDAVMRFIAPLLNEAANDVLVNHKIEDPKSQFQEWVQSKGFQPPKYSIKSATGPDHERLFEVEAVVDGVVYGSGCGTSKQAATKAAARNALSKLGITSGLDQENE